MPKKVLDMKITNRSVQYGNWPSKGAYNGHKHFICRQFDHNQENIDEIDRIHSLQYYPGLVKSIGIQIIDSRMYQIIQYIKGSKIDKETNVDQLYIFLSQIIKFLESNNIQIHNITQNSVLKCNNQFYLIDYGLHHKLAQQLSTTQQLAKILLFCKPSIGIIPIKSGHQRIILKRKLQQCKEDCVEHIILKSQFESVIM
eukprot:EST46931.1 Hypothetical protein SS50377_13088 [Spironucleus salmonicida]